MLHSDLYRRLTGLQVRVEKQVTSCFEFIYLKKKSYFVKCSPVASIQNKGNKMVLQVSLNCYFHAKTEAINEVRPTRCLPSSSTWGRHQISIRISFSQPVEKHVSECPNQHAQQDSCLILFQVIKKIDWSLVWVKFKVFHQEQNDRFLMVRLIRHHVSLHF